VKISIKLGYNIFLVRLFSHHLTQVQANYSDSFLKVAYTGNIKANKSFLYLAKPSWPGFGLFK